MYTSPPVKSSGRAGTVSMVAGVLCLDFVNTVDPRIEPEDGRALVDFLTSYADLVLWGRRAETLGATVAPALLEAAARDDRAATAVLAQAEDLRELLYRVFLAIARRDAIAAEDLAALGAAYAEAMSHLRLTQQDTDVVLDWPEDAADLARPLWPIARSAVDLLLQGEPERIKECPEGCGWLFYDATKNASRRWCSMRGCGSHAKERRRGKRIRRKPASPAE